MQNTWITSSQVVGRGNGGDVQYIGLKGFKEGEGLPKRNLRNGGTTSTHSHNG